MSPPFGSRAKSETARSISPTASLVLIGLTSMPRDGAADCMTANWPTPGAMALGQKQTYAVQNGMSPLPRKQTSARDFDDSACVRLPHQKITKLLPSNRTTQHLSAEPSTGLTGSI